MNTKLIESAKEAAFNAYAPYSNFRVGAAVLFEDGTIIKGANIENRSYGLTNCAERSAIFYGISSGRKKVIEIAVFGADSAIPLPPCGACRQVISEFAPADTLIHCISQTGEIKSYTVKELLPADSLHDLTENNS